MTLSITSTTSALLEPLGKPTGHTRVYSLDEMLHSIKPFSREVARRLKRANGALTFRPLLNGRNCRLGFRYARLFTINDYEYEDIRAKSPATIPLAEIDELFLSATDLPPCPHWRSKVPKPHTEMVKPALRVSCKTNPLSDTKVARNPTPSVLSKPTYRDLYYLAKGIFDEESSYSMGKHGLEDSRSDSTRKSHDATQIPSILLLALIQLRRDGYNTHRRVPLGMDARPCLQYTVRVGDDHQLVSVHHLKWTGEYPIGAKLIRRPVLNHDSLRLLALQNSLNAAYISKHTHSHLTGVPITTTGLAFSSPSSSIERPAKLLLYSQPIREWDAKHVDQIIVRRRIQFRSPLVKSTGPDVPVEISTRPTNLFGPCQPERGRSGERLPRLKIQPFSTHPYLPETSSRFLSPI